MKFPSLNPLRVPPLIPLRMGFGKKLGKSEKGFVVLPKLHPDYVCGFNSCEDLDDWSISGDLIGSINKSMFEENIGSLHLQTDPIESTAGGLAIIYPAWATCNEYLGFWARFTYQPTWMNMDFTWLDNAGNYRMTQFYYSPDRLRLEVAIAARNVMKAAAMKGNVMENNSTKKPLARAPTNHPDESAAFIMPIPLPRFSPFRFEAMASAMGVNAPTAIPLIKLKPMSS